MAQEVSKTTIFIALGLFGGLLLFAFIADKRKEANPPPPPVNEIHGIPRFTGENLHVPKGELLGRFFDLSFAGAFTLTLKPIKGALPQVKIMTIGDFVALRSSWGSMATSYSALTNMVMTGTPDGTRMYSPQGKVPAGTYVVAVFGSSTEDVDLGAMVDAR